MGILVEPKPEELLEIKVTKSRMATVLSRHSAESHHTQWRVK